MTALPAAPWSFENLILSSPIFRSSSSSEDRSKEFIKVLSSVTSETKALRFATREESPPEKVRLSCPIVLSDFSLPESSQRSRREERGSELREEQESERVC